MNQQLMEIFGISLTRELRSNFIVFFCFPFSIMQNYLLVHTVNNETCLCIKMKSGEQQKQMMMKNNKTVKMKSKKMR